MNDIKFLVMDVDGTLTDGKIYMGESGELIKTFDIKDGCGIKDILPQFEIVPVIITARKSEILAKRCDELGIMELYQGCRNKLKKLEEVLQKYSDTALYTLADVAYIGDDLLDLKCMMSIQKAGGIAICPDNAIKEIKEIANFVCNSKGGEGAIREFINWYTKKSNGKGLKKVLKVSREAYNFLKDFNLSDLVDGRYELGDGTFANVMTYMTKPLGLTCFEAHRKYIDIQYVIYGKELLITENVEKLDDCISSEYNSETDIVKFKYDSGNITILDAGDVAVLYPSDAHRGTVTVEKPVRIRKVVIKVPYMS